MNITNHPQVESYWIEEFPNGIIHLLINTKNRGCYFHQLSDTDYLITQREVEDYNREDLLTIPEFLKRDKNIIYLSAVEIEKDQINVYFIPYRKEWHKYRKFIIK